MQGEDKLILKGFKEAGIYGVISDAQEIFERVENKSSHKNSLLKAA